MDDKRASGGSKSLKRYGFELTEEKESDAFGKLLIEQKFELRNI